MWTKTNTYYNTMRIPALFRRYIWLVNTIHYAKNITLAEINDKWLNSDLSEGEPLARATFNRYKTAIEEIFDIIIECDRRDGYTYYIRNAEVLEGDTLQKWLLSTLSVGHIVTDNIHLQDRMLLENIPSGEGVLQTVIEAMKNGVAVSFFYHKYGAGQSYKVVVEPYCVKLFQKRWYMLGHFSPQLADDIHHSDSLRIYSLDRITDLEATTLHFDMDEDFSAREFFSECYGVTVGDGSVPQRVVVRTLPWLSFYLNDLPMHVSQRKIARCDEYTDFELFIRPTNDFINCLMGWGAAIKVLEPRSLAEKLKNSFLEAASQYE